MCSSTCLPDGGAGHAAPRSSIMQVICFRHASVLDKLRPYVTHRLIKYFDVKFLEISPAFCCMFLMCFTVISRISAFSNLACCEVYRETTHTHTPDKPFKHTCVSRFWCDVSRALTDVFKKRLQDEGFQATQAAVNASSSSFLHQRLGKLKKPTNITV